MRISTNQIYQQGLDSLLTQQARTTELQQQLSDGIRVQSPSDDPIAAAQIELMSQRIKSTELYQRNLGSVQGRLNTEEGILSGTVTALQRIRQLQVQAGDSALSDKERQNMAVEIGTLLNQLQDFANTKDSDGYYIFAGSQTASPPITKSVSGQFIYNGDDTQRYQSITDSLQVAVNDTADAIFMRIPNGNGTFTVNQTGTANQGTGIATSGTVANAAAYVADNYTLNFITNSQGQLVVMVSGAASGNVIPPSGLPDDAPLYVDGAVIDFNGMQLSVTGAPQAGDVFSVSPAKSSSVFATVQSMIDNLNAPFSSPADKAATQTINNQLLDELDSALQTVLNTQADVGSRLNQLQSVDLSNQNLLITSQDILRSLREIDPTKVAVEFNQQLTNLQAAQQSFVRIQNLSVFNYI